VNRANKSLFSFSGRTAGIIIGLVCLTTSLVYFTASYFNARCEVARYQSELADIRARLAEVELQLSASLNETGASNGDIQAYIKPDDPQIRNAAAAALSQAPKGIEANNDVWKIWRVNNWIATSISYISDPLQSEYYAQPVITLEAGAGDCDDMSILLASAYESVGLDAAIAYVDTAGDGEIDHMSVLVYYADDVAAFTARQDIILRTLSLFSPTGESSVRYITANSYTGLVKYDTGTWLVVDPSMSPSSFHVGYITQWPYTIITAIDVGS